MHDDVDALFAEAALQGGMKGKFPIQHVFDAAFGFDVKIDIAAALAVIHPRTKQPHVSARPKGLMGGLTDSFSLLAGESHGDVIRLIGDQACARLRARSGKMKPSTQSIRNRNSRPTMNSMIPAKPCRKPWPASSPMW